VTVHAPEPRSFAMLLAGLVGACVAGRRNREPRTTSRRLFAGGRGVVSRGRGLFSPALRRAAPIALVAAVSVGAAGQCGPAGGPAPGAPQIIQEIVEIQGYVEPYTPGSGAPEEVILAADHPVVRLLGPNPNLNKVTYIRTALDKADGTTPDTILILIPGFLGGGTTFDPLARQLVDASAGNIEVWAVDRRPNQLEDRLGATFAESGAGSAACTQSPPAADCEIYQGAQFYFPDVDAPPLDDPTDPNDFPGAGDLDLNLNGIADVQRPLVDSFGVSRTAINMAQNDVREFFAHWGVDTFVRDWKILAAAARARVDQGGKHGVVLMGGHSQGTTWATTFAAYDFDPDPNVVDAGHTHIDGLILLEGGGVGPGIVTKLSLAAYEIWIKAVGLPDTQPAFLSDFSGIPLVALGNSGEVAAIAGHFQPSEPALIQRTPTFGSGLVSILLSAPATNKAVAGFFLDDDFSPIGAFRASIGFSDNGANNFTTLPGLLPFYLAAPAGGGGVRTWIDSQNVDPVCVDPLVSPGCALVDNGPPSDQDDPIERPKTNGVEREVSDIDEFLRTQFGKANGFEWYFVDTRLDRDFEYGNDSSALVAEYVARDGDEGLLNVTQNANVDIPVLAFGGTNGLAPEPKSFQRYFDSIATLPQDKRAVMLDGYAHVDPTIADDNDAVSPIIDFVNELLQRELLANY
jgi:pimeloyl-ACP methyl ester carboxylesterase